MASTVKDWTPELVYRQLFLDSPYADPAKVDGSKWEHVTITYAFPTSKTDPSLDLSDHYVDPLVGRLVAIGDPLQLLMVRALSTWDDLIPQKFEKLNHPVLLASFRTLNLSTQNLKLIFSP